eukprot:1157119-Pelagomonas_calceolata.AAC.15
MVLALPQCHTDVLSLLAGHALLAHRAWTSYKSFAHFKRCLTCVVYNLNGAHFAAVLKPCSSMAFKLLPICSRDAGHSRPQQVESPHWSAAEPEQHTLRQSAQARALQ